MTRATDTFLQSGDCPRGLLHLNGEWVPSADGATTAVIDPATEEVYGHVARASEGDVDSALAAAKTGFAIWRRTDAWTRSATLRRVAELLRSWTDEAALIMTSEQGKPLAESRAEWAATADQFDWYADEARRIYGRTVDAHTTDVRITVKREPVGIVAAFASWNFPALLPARKIAPALAAGCSVIAKPAEDAPFSTLLIAEACRAAGLPAGVLNMVTGDSRMISARLIASMDIRKISLTGSVPVGRQLLALAAQNITEVSMELGGHAPVLVFPDADVETAARLCAAAKFRNTGQVCASPSRFIVHDDAVERFTQAFASAASALRVGDGRDPETQVGPLTNRRRVDAAEALVADAVSRGASVRVGGGRSDAFDRGFFFDPTVLTDVAADSEILREEPFAPVAPVSRFSDLDDALRQANSVDYGLASYVFTRDLSIAHLASEGIEAGMVGVNHLALATAEAPFGGVKLSGYGREGGSEGVLHYTHAKYVNMKVS